MTSRFTPAAERVLNRALTEARSMGHTYIGTEHLLLGLLFEKDCVACRILGRRGIAYEDRHIKLENPSYEELKEWYSRSGLPLKRFFNTSGLQYKALGLKDRLPTMTEEEQLRLLATDGMLVKRPIVVTDNIILTGFKEAEWEEKL